ncbi:Phosphoglycolate phosphatase, HAD superfamily [Streptomyces sp. 2131.1]|uniref:HAD family hydrolase n=1 Tax=Streptomyces sp. 2131.1 TaxID=1855346 RepID=UPI0008979D67|nr:HAD family hydrolase [Streptomyces sp. 2131.1]SED51329.1 Phosphoglycolate phosphatase, HAD superfamily [Streptomyces sp. 2131.1]
MGIAPGDHRTHLVWDWNGTLLDDNTAVVGATNAAFGEVGLAPITVEQYREMYCIPIPRFYERLMGRLPTDAEWERMDGVFHRHYTEQRDACGLTAGAAELLAQWQLTGRSQSIMSMYRHEELLPVVRGFGIERHFVRVDGRTGPSGGSKSEYMARHLAAMEAISPHRTVVIGDAVDDAVAAAHAGAKAVLYTGGSHSRASLEKAGVPVVDSLTEAITLAEQLTR